MTCLNWNRSFFMKDSEVFLTLTHTGCFISAGLSRSESRNEAAYPLRYLWHRPRLRQDLEHKEDTTRGAPPKNERLEVQKDGKVVFGGVSFNGNCVKIRLTHYVLWNLEYFFVPQFIGILKQSGKFLGSTQQLNICKPVTLYSGVVRKILK